MDLYRRFSQKSAFTLVEIMIVVVIIGILASIAVPSFSKVREKSRATAILNNLRQIASVGQQYILERGVQLAQYTDLINDGYLQPIKQVAGEDYLPLTILEQGGTIQVTTTGGQVVQYTY